MALLREECFSKNWNVKPLGEVVDFLDNLRRPVKSEDRVEGEYNYYGANGLQGAINDFLFDEPLILLAEDGGHFGNPERDIAYIAKGKYWVNNHAHVLKPKAGLELDFLYRVLQRYDVTKYIKGATRAKLTKGDAAMMPIPIPPLEEQKRIAAILDKADTIRRKRQQAIKLADEFLRSVFLDMFGDPVTNPKGFPASKLGDLCEDLFLGLTSKVDYVDGGEGYPLVRAKDINTGELSFEEVKYISEDQHRKLTKNHLTRKGDLLVSKSGTLGTCAIVRTDRAFSTYESIFTVRPDNSRLDLYYLIHLLQNKGFKEKLIGNKVGGTVAHLNLKMFRDFEIGVPPIALQHQFSKTISKIEAKLERYKVSFHEAEALFSSLSQKAFSGELNAA